jgi:hypothetical protein
MCALLLCDLMLDFECFWLHVAQSIQGREWVEGVPRVVGFERSRPLGGCVGQVSRSTGCSGASRGCVPVGCSSAGACLWSIKGIKLHVTDLLKDAENDILIFPKK